MSEFLSRDVESQVLSDVRKVLGDDDSGHGIDHIERVWVMSKRFANQISEPVDINIVILAALLHDVDDYKLVGRERSRLQANAIEIMNNVGIDEVTQLAVRVIIANMGYSTALKGIRPTTIEGKIVSDADMCDAIGVGGIVRCLQYAVSSKGSGVIFDSNAWPTIDITADQYNQFDATRHNDSFVNHFFEKLLKLKGIMLTEPGLNEATIRDEQMVTFLQEFFREENATKWSKMLETYLNQRL